MIATMLKSILGESGKSADLSQALAEARGLLAEFNRSKCLAEYTPQGVIVGANENWLNVMGYDQAEVVNQHHSKFTAQDYSESPEYRVFWQALGQGRGHAGAYRLVGKNGEAAWMQGEYFPLQDADGKVCKVVSCLTDVTADRLRTIAGEREFDRIKGAINGSSAAVMTVDRDFIVTYVNEATRRLFSDNLEEFRKAFPSFDPSGIVGTCIDVFHRNPSHQRQLLSDPSRLPFKTQIKVGSLNIMLYVTASMDKEGNYIGNSLEWRDVTAEMNAAGQISAINKKQGVIEFDLTGKITRVNENFAKVTGYSENEIVGQHHSMFIDAAFKGSQEYKAFWEKLGRGEADTGLYRRIGKGGREIWLQASYNPILDMNGKPFKVVKYATDVTQSKLADADNAGQLAAIDKIQGVIEFDLTGRILKVNENFAKVTGYSGKELVGQHHSLFVDAKYRDSQS